LVEKPLKTALSIKFEWPIISDGEGCGNQRATASTDSTATTGGQSTVQIPQAISI
jgi:hypothetical protein